MSRQAITPPLPVEEQKLEDFEELEIAGKKKKGFQSFLMFDVVGSGAGYDLCLLPLERSLLTIANQTWY